MSSPYHHRSGPLKQKNKTHKTGKHDSKSLLFKKSGGKVEDVKTSGKTISVSGKQTRRQRGRQLRVLAKENVQKVKEIGSLQGAPKIVAIVGLSNDADTGAVVQCYHNKSSKVVKITNQLTYCTIASEKKRFLLYEVKDNLVITALDAAKVADIIVYVLPMKNGVESCIDAYGDSVISAIRSQGVPSLVVALQGIDKVGKNKQGDLKQQAKRLVDTEFGANVKLAETHNDIQMIRALSTAPTKPVHWRDMRSYMLADSCTLDQVDSTGCGKLRLTGFIRGKPLSANQLVHIPDVGTFQLGMVEQVANPLLKEIQDKTILRQIIPQPNAQEDLKYEADVDPFAAEQTWPTEEELNGVQQEEDTQAALPPGVSSYQASWMPCNEEGQYIMDDGNTSDAESENEALEEVAKTAPRDDADSLDGNMSMDEDDHDHMKSLEDYRNLKKLEQDDIEFSDEFDVPAGMSARQRLARYRGLKSFRTSFWDPKESLPRDYARLFQFENFPLMQRDELSKLSKIEANLSNSSTQVERSSSMNIENEQLDSYLLSGSYVHLYLPNVPQDSLDKINPNAPLVIGSLFPNENRASVVHFNIQRHSSYQEPLKSKDVVTIHCGFRRYDARPIYSDQNLNSDKHRFQRFLPRGGWSVASVYGPSTYCPANVLVFKSSQLVAAGSLAQVNPDRIVVKRSVLTGVPVKVKCRKAVIRYMFHYPSDIQWFLPIGLTTKHGLTGHIKESLGTHGDFKAVFSKPVQQHDTVCLQLYKRVYPKLLE